MLVVLALISLQHMVNEIIAAFLGPLPLFRRPKSKPVTPYAVMVAILSVRRRRWRDRKLCSNDESVGTTTGRRPDRFVVKLRRLLQPARSARNAS